MFLLKLFTVLLAMVFEVNGDGHIINLLSYIRYPGHLGMLVNSLSVGLPNLTGRTHFGCQSAIPANSCAEPAQVRATIAFRDLANAAVCHHRHCLRCSACKRRTWSRLEYNRFDHHRHQPLHTK